MRPGAVRVLLVCTANVCRSPLAAGLLAFHADKMGAPIRVASASIDRETRDLHPSVSRILEQRGVELVRTTSRPLSDELVDQVDFVLVMTVDHAMSVVGRFADARPKVFLLDHFGQVVQPQPRTHGFEHWLHGLYAQPRDYSANDQYWEVPDPIGQPEAAFEELAELLDEVTCWIATVLASVYIDSAQPD